MPTQPQQQQHACALHIRRKHLIEQQQQQHRLDSTSASHMNVTHTHTNAHQIPTKKIGSHICSLRYGLAGWLADWSVGSLLEISEGENGRYIVVCWVSASPLLTFVVVISKIDGVRSVTLPPPPRAHGKKLLVRDTITIAAPHTMLVIMVMVRSAMMMLWWWSLPYRLSSCECKCSRVRQYAFATTIMFNDQRSLTFSDAFAPSSMQCADATRDEESSPAPKLWTRAHCSMCNEYNI